MKEPKFEDTAPVFEETKPVEDVNSYSNIESEKTKPSKLSSVLRGGVQGATLGFSDEITGLLESLVTDKSYSQARDESRLNYDLSKTANPKSYGGGEIGGSLATFLLPFLGSAKIAQGLSKGAQAAKLGVQGLKTGAVYGLGSSRADLTEGDYSGAAVDTGLGATFGGLVGGAMPYAGPLIGKGLMGLDNKTGNVASKGLKKGFGAVDDFIKNHTPQMKPNADATRAAAAELGIEPSPSMLYDSPYIAKTQSALEQSPTLVAAGARGARSKVEKGLIDAVEDATQNRSNLNPFEAGEAAKQKIYESVNKKFDPISQSYDDLYAHTKKIPVNPKSLDRVVKNMRKDETIRLGLGEAKAAVDAVEKRIIADPISSDGIQKMMGTLKGELRKAVSGSEKKAIGDLIGRLDKVNQNTIKREAVKNARTGAEGKKIGQGIIDQLKNTNSQYREGISGLTDFSKKTGLKRFRGKQQFKDIIENLKSEQVTDKLYPTGNRAAREQTKNLFPEAAEILKQRKVSDLVQGTSDTQGISARKFLNKTKDYDDNFIEDLFGKRNKLGAARKVTDAIPDKVGPSGTPEGMSYFGAGAFDLKQNAADVAKRIGLKGAMNAGNISKGLNNLVTKTPEAFGKFAPTLQQAAQRGGTSLAATNFVLQQTDEEYRDKLKDYFGDK